MNGKTLGKKREQELLDLRGHLAPKDRANIEDLIYLLSKSTSNERAAALSLVRNISESSLASPETRTRRLEQAISYLRSREK